MIKENLKYLIILAILIGLGFLAYRWHVDRLEAVKREEIAKTEGIIKEKERQLVLMKAEGVKLKKIADSAISAISTKDTIVIRKKYEVKIDNVRNLGTDASIAALSNNLSR